MAHCPLHLLPSLPTQVFSTIPATPKWPRRSFGDIYQGSAESLCLLFTPGEPLREGQPEVIVFSTISVTYVEQSVRNSGCCSSWCVERV